jgi:hypothetical protein
MQNTYNTIEKYISSARLNRYMVISNQDTSKALKLYQTNIRLSQSFYPLLSLLEIILRNAINDLLIKEFNDNNWILSQRSLFMSDARLGPKFYLRTEIRKRIEKLNFDNKRVTSDNIISGLTLGFWVAFFYPDNFAVLRGAPLRILSNKPTSLSGTEFKKQLDRIREFRNKIYHNEPIIFTSSNLNVPSFTLNHIESIYEDIKRIFGYFDLNFKLWTRRIDNIPLEISRAKTVINFYPGKRYYYHRLKVGVNHLRYKYSNN